MLGLISEVFSLLVVLTDALIIRRHWLVCSILRQVNFFKTVKFFYSSCIFWKIYESQIDAQQTINLNNPIAPYNKCQRIKSIDR